MSAAAERHRGPGYYRTLAEHPLVIDDEKGVKLYPSQFEEIRQTSLADNPSTIGREISVVYRWERTKILIGKPGECPPQGFTPLPHPYRHVAEVFYQALPLHTD